MLKNYFSIAVRNLLKYRFYSLINIVGLSVGIAACLLMVFFIQNELSFDKHHAKGDRIYRMTTTIDFGGKHMELANLPAPMAQTLPLEFPEIEEAFRIRNWGTFQINRPDEPRITVSKIFYADSSIFRVFTFDILEGPEVGILNGPKALAISKSAREVHFPDPAEDPIGQILLLDGNEYEVRSVFDDIPQTSHFDVDYIMSMEGHGDSNNALWLSNNYFTYFLLKEGTNIEDVEAKLPSLVEKYVLPQVQQFISPDIKKLEDSGDQLEYGVQHLYDIHLYSNLDFEIGVNGDIEYIYLFSAIGIFILLIACINFMNLATARSATRSVEVGIRKVLGSIRGQLIAQFLVEAFLVTLLAMVFGVILLEIILPFFNIYYGRELSLDYFSNPLIPIAMIGILLLVSLIAGSYPAFFLSSFQPVRVLKGTIASGLRSGSLRKVLVVFQFGVSIFLIISTMVVSKQLRYIREANLGFDKEQVLIIEGTSAVFDQREVFRERLVELAAVQQATVSSFLPVTNSARSDMGFWPEGKDRDPMYSVSLQTWQVDPYYIETLKLNLLEGRNFSPDRKTDTAAVILNQKAVALFGFKDDPLGKVIQSFDLAANGIPTEDYDAYEVIGVIEDFHFDSFKNNISALGLFMDKPWSGYIPVRLSGGRIEDGVQQIESIWDEFVDDQAFDYMFLDEEFDAMYKNEQQVAEIFGSFSILAIFVASLGLFALAAFTAEQRTKEIGVRKVMGASIWDVVVLLSREFNVLVLISFIIFAPLAWYLMEQWLQDYAYRTHVDILTLAIAGMSSFLVAWLTVSYQSIKAGMLDPVKSLRYE